MYGCDTYGYGAGEEVQHQHKHKHQSSSDAELFKCSSDDDCQLNGDCIDGRRNCFASWRGFDCSSLFLLPPSDMSPAYPPPELLGKKKRRVRLHICERCPRPSCTIGVHSHTTGAHTGRIHSLLPVHPHPLLPLHPHSLLPHAITACTIRSFGLRSCTPCSTPPSQHS
jgi:hypothetical protein